MIIALTPEGLAVMPASLLALLLAFLLPTRTNSPNPALFRGFLLFGSLFLVALQVELMTEEPFRRRAAAFQYVVLLVALTLFTQFAYRFAQRRNLYEPVIVAGCQLLALVVVLLGLIPLLDTEHPSDVPLQWMNLIILASFVWIVIVFLRQALHPTAWKHRQTQGMPWLTPDELTAGAFALILLLPVALLLALIALESRLIDRFIYHTINSLGILIFVALLVELFLRWQRRATPGRLMLIAPRDLRMLTVVLTLCGVAQVPLISWYKRDYYQSLDTNVVSVLNLLDGGSLPENAVLPEAVAFVMLLQPEGKIIYSRVGAVHEQLVRREVINAIDRTNTVYQLDLQRRNPSLDSDVSRFFNRQYGQSNMRPLSSMFGVGLLNLGTSKPQYQYVRVLIGERSLLIAFPYAAYQAYLQRLLGAQALAIVAISTLSTGLIVGAALIRLLLFRPEGSDIFD